MKHDPEYAAARKRRHQEYHEKKKATDSNYLIKRRAQSKRWREKNRQHATEYDSQRRINRKRELVDYLGGRCCRCGYDDSLSALDFHHLTPVSEKPEQVRISTILNHSKEKTLAEIKGCVLLCANCHREITHNGERRFYAEESETQLCHAGV